MKTMMLCISCVLVGGCCSFLSSSQSRTGLVDRALRASRTDMTYEQFGHLNPLPPSKADMREMRDILSRPPYGSGKYHLLRMIDEYGSSELVTVDARTAILVSTLGEFDDVYDFGMLDHPTKLSRAGQLLVACGVRAIAPLAALLKDRTRVGMTGSEDSGVANSYSFRRCDYAYMYIKLIQGKTPAFDEDVNQRDKRIAELSKELASDASKR